MNQIEAGYTKRILELVEPIVGHDNLRASVTADVDFSQTEATSEEFKPNQGADASVSIRSQQTTEQGGAGGGALAERRAGRGVEPAADRRDRAAHRRVAAAAGRADRQRRRQRRPARGGHQLRGRQDRARHASSATGNVKRLNAAVVVNNRSVTDAKGKTTQVPLAAEEIEKLTALVRESIGFNKERGDSVKVINAPFKVEPVGDARRDAVLEEPRADRPDPRRGAAGRPRARRRARLLRPGAARR